MLVMADGLNKETSISEIELMEAFRGAINNFEARKMTKKVASINFTYDDTGKVTYKFVIRDLSST